MRTAGPGREHRQSGRCDRAGRRRDCSAGSSSPCPASRACTPLRDKRAALIWLWSALARDELRIDVRTFVLDELPAAWRDQAASPHAKYVVLPADGGAHRTTTGTTLTPPERSNVNLSLVPTAAVPAAPLFGPDANSHSAKEPDA